MGQYVFWPDEGAMQRNVTMKDVAKRAGVSQRTVSNVVSGYTHVSDRTRSRVLQAIDDLGYRPNIAAQQLRAGKTGIVALAVPNMAWPYFGEMAHLVQEYAQLRGLTLLIWETEGSRTRETQVLEGIHHNLIDGLILSAIEVTSDDIHRIRDRMPVVLIGEKIRNAGVPHFEIDGRQAAEEVIHHLVECGAKSLVVLGTHDTTMTTGPGTPRAQGVLQATQSLLGESAMLGTITVSPWTYEGAYEMTTAWLKHHDLPDAIFSMNDIMAAGALRALADLGARVPDDVLLTGWDDTDVARFSLPSITTVRPDKATIARSAVDALVALIQDPDATGGDTVIPHELVIRESTVGRQTGSLGFSASTLPDTSIPTTAR